MRYYELLREFRTKDGREITVSVEEDSEGDDNRGFIVHKFTATVDEQPVGYLKVSYIPLERYRKYFKSIFNYLASMRGWSILPYGDKYATVEDLPDEDLWRLLDNQSRYPYGASVDLTDNMSREELLAKVKDVEKRLLRSFGEHWRGLRRHHVDKPMVDYISVDLRRQRVALALYMTAARWLAQHKLRFYASGLQSDEAQGAWDFMKRQGWTGRDQRGLYLKPMAVKPV